MWLHLYILHTTNVNRNHPVSLNRKVKVYKHKTYFKTWPSVIAMILNSKKHTDKNFEEKITLKQTIFSQHSA